MELAAAGEYPAASLINAAVVPLIAVGERDDQAKIGAPLLKQPDRYRDNPGGRRAVATERDAREFARLTRLATVPAGQETRPGTEHHGADEFAILVDGELGDGNGANFAEVMPTSAGFACGGAITRLEE